jgi:1-pyrroline-5-carboxylate dehydrogenase
MSLDFVTVDPDKLNKSTPCKLCNLVGGKWIGAKKYLDIIDPMNGDPFIQMPDTKVDELGPFIESINAVPKSGLHNPFKNVDRYVMYGRITFKMATELAKPEVQNFFARVIQRVCPKSYPQAIGEVKIVHIFLQNFSGDQVRFLARGFTNPGDHQGQRSTGNRFPFGSVVVVSPFNFPLEIPVLQVMGALYMGNHVTLKAASTTSIVMEEWVRFMLSCGVPANDIDLIHCGGRVMGELCARSRVRSMQFTGSSEVAENLTQVLHGRIKIEDAGFDWKIFGPDVSEMEYVSWQCDQDCYANTGQKCSKQSIVFAHANWVKSGLIEKMKERAAIRKLDDLTVAPILSHTTEEILGHVNKLLQIPGAYVAFGGKELKNHTIPKCYGALEPTAVFVPLQYIDTPEWHHTVCTEIFGPFQILTQWETEEDLHHVINVCEMMDQHLTAAIVSSDILFINKVLGSTINGTTYVGIRGRTTGAPQNHWFGPAGDPRCAGIGTPEAIILVWSCHREVIEDHGPIAAGWTVPVPT